MYLENTNLSILYYLACFNLFFHQFSSSWPCDYRLYQVNLLTNPLPASHHPLQQFSATEMFAGQSIT